MICRGSDDNGPCHEQAGDSGYCHSHDPANPFTVLVPPYPPVATDDDKCSDCGLPTPSNTDVREHTEEKCIARLVKQRDALRLTPEQYGTLGRLFEVMQLGLQARANELTRYVTQPNPNPWPEQREHTKRMLTAARDEAKAYCDVVGAILDAQKAGLR